MFTVDPRYDDIILDFSVSLVSRDQRNLVVKLRVVEMWSLEACRL